MKYADKFLQKSSFLIHHFFSLFSYSSESRIIIFFRSMARDYGHEIKGLPGLKSIPIQLNYMEIAKLTSTTPDKVMKVLDDLNAREIVRYYDNRCLIRI
jgi:CRP-like cAMP-binding protein